MSIWYWPSSRRKYVSRLESILVILSLRIPVRLYRRCWRNSNFPPYLSAKKKKIIKQNITTITSVKFYLINKPFLSYIPPRWVKNTLRPCYKIVLQYTYIVGRLNHRTFFILVSCHREITNLSNAYYQSILTLPPSWLNRYSTTFKLSKIWQRGRTNFTPFSYILLFGIMPGILRLLRYRHRRVSLRIIHNKKEFTECKSILYFNKNTL